MEDIVIRCKICNSANCKHLFDKNNSKIFKCLDCEIVFCENTSETDIKEIYNIEYFEGKKEFGYLSYSKSEAVLKKHFNFVLKKILTLKPERCKLLEIGSAYGFFLELAQKHYDCIGIEISKDANEIARSRGLNVLEGDLENSTIINNGKYEIVVMFDIIEHLENPVSYIQSISKLIAKDGIIIITTGDIDSILAKIMGKTWRLMTPPEHLFYFSKKTLSTLLAKNGFEIIKISYPFKFVPISLIGYQISRLTGIKRYNFLKKRKGGVYVNLYDSIELIAKKI